MTRVNVEAADRLVRVFMGWADMSEDDIRHFHPDFDPQPDTYEEDLRRFVSAYARTEADRLHPQGLDIVKAAMRWIIRDAPDFAEDTYSASLYDLEQPPEPRVKLWQWAWEAVFGDESWDIPGEEFELFSDTNDVNYYAARNWDRRPPPTWRPFTWHTMPLDYP